MNPETHAIMSTMILRKPDPCDLLVAVIEESKVDEPQLKTIVQVLI